MVRKDLRAVKARRSNAASKNKEGRDIRLMSITATIALALTACGGGGGGGGSGGSAPRAANQAGQVTVSGIATQHQVLMAMVTDGNGTAGTISYQWMANGEPIAGASGASLQLTQAQVGKTISVRASYTDSAGYAETVTSNSTPAVVDVDDPAIISLARSGIAVTDFAGGNNIAYGMATYGDGRSLLLGRAYNGTAKGSDIALARYNNDGSLDATFGDAGKVMIDFNGLADDSYANPLILADGKILVGGASIPAVGSGNDFALVRLNPDGSLDGSFGVGGKATLDFLSGADWINAIALTPAGKIVAVGGTIAQEDGSIRVAIAQFLATGAPDTGFGDGGRIRAQLMVDSIQGDSYANDLRILADGRMMLTGIAAGRFAVARLLANGSLDPGYGSGGVVVSELSSGDDEANRMNVMADGSVIVVGSVQNRTGMVVMKYLPNGQPDPAFTRTIHFNNALEILYDVAVTSSGDILGAGFSFTSAETGGTNLLLTRMRSNGVGVPGFGNGGILRRDYSASTDYGYAIRSEADGGITVAGAIYNTAKLGGDFALWRFDANGQPSRTFGVPYAAYREGAAPVPLAPGSTLSDPDISGTVSANYAGYHLVLRRAGTPTGEDRFAGSGNVTIANGTVTVAGASVGSYTQSAGVLDVVFNAGATQAAVNSVVDALAYSTPNILAAGPVNIEWLIVDTAGKSSAPVYSTVMVANDLADTGDPGIVFTDSRPYFLTNLWSLGNGSYLYQTSRAVLHWELTQYWVPGRLLNSAEALAFARDPNRPEQYRTGTFWTGSSSQTGHHDTINMANGTLGSAPDSNRYRGLFKL